MPPKQPAPGLITKTIHKVHDSKHSRLLEFLFWGIPGALLAGGGYLLWKLEWVSAAISLIMAVVGISLIGWAMMPPAKQPEKEAVAGRRRAEIAAARRR